MPEILLLEEVAEITRIPLPTLRFYRHSGKGPKTFRLGNRVVVKKADLDTWIEERYNRLRRHSSIGMISPVRFEELHTQTAKAA